MIAPLALAVLGLLALGLALMVAPSHAGGVRVPPSVKPPPEPMKAGPGTPAAPGVPWFVMVDGLDALPLRVEADRSAFLAGFRGAFAEPRLATERVREEGEPSAEPPIGNRFRLLEGEAEGFDDVWKAQVSFDRLDATQVQVSWWAVSAAAAEVVRVAPERAHLVVPARPGASENGFDRIGREVALLLLDTLHHASGDLDDDVRVRLEAERVPTPVDTPLPRGRR